MNVLIINKQPIKFSPSILNILDIADSKKTILITKSISYNNFDYDYLNKFHLLDADFQLGPFELLIRFLLDYLRYSKFPEKSVFFQKYGLINKSHKLREIFKIFHSQLITKILLFFRAKHLILLFDIDSLLLFQKFHFKSSHLIYYDLELRLVNDLDWVKKVNEVIENKLFSRVQKVIIQSEERYNLLVENYKDFEGTRFYLPVTYSDKNVTNSKFQLHKKLGLNSNEKIVLHVGGLIEDLGILELVNQLVNIQGYHFVFIGYSNPQYLDMILKQIPDGFKRIHFLDMDLDHPSQLEELINGAYIGIAWYQNISENMRTAIFSSGKISLYTKLGIPIITNNYYSFKKFLKHNPIGIGISNINEINNAINLIEVNYKLFSSTSKFVFNKYFKFENYTEGLKKFFEQ